jgi:hypothetical protein
MNNNHTSKPASQIEITLYCHMGEAVCMIQELESALTASITIKKHSNATWAEADEALNKQRYSTLGKAVMLAEKESLLPPALQAELNAFYQRRNWLIHQAMFETRDDRSSETVWVKLFDKIKDIADDARRLQRAIEMDLIDFCQSKGKDMSKVLALMEQHEKGQ